MQVLQPKFFLICMQWGSSPSSSSSSPFCQKQYWQSISLKSSLFPIFVNQENVFCEGLTLIKIIFHLFKQFLCIKIICLLRRKTVFLWRSTGTYKKKLSCILSLPLHFSTVGSRTSYVCKKKMPSRRNLGHHLKDLNRCKAGIRIWTILIRWNKLNYFPFFNSDRIFSFLQNNILNRCTVSHCSVLIFII